MIDDASPTVNRREFLGFAPRHLLGGIRTVLDQTMALAAVRVTEHPSTARSDGHQGRAKCRTRWASGQQIAIIDPARCLAWGGGACQTCYLRCPLRDEAMVLDGGKPTIVAQSCDGCGVCVEVCRTVNDLGAIRLV
ncbi:MAG: hypothetical protein A3I71_01175 [Omnitrophica WOR_2 bacterium RIFCSPLOWO2_02_FULL_63_16]|nr:MAG: hypothetical protein A2Z92_05785 [Omnitrophica WOR_2 bacterium GWA2_63_20]OGX31777.1 MAG: hypothetical protein A3E56_00375 [Omnitrophica WOR_2 bacterium RIFCSPHIGHO2_12_FULL_64_13]OGX35744.1 MAG: hypothetical protein A3B73_03405 [Omnitrophica WOR_2 bacterium RIFCSPHIGHO2_02_FULL_63_39]OGX45764.1 MAG: hypothetical protein A3I71_01175 [Omnitrophica WOR_2 bacterium RIFCSPLOWO2_02_FULL_63_16]OGX49395.1 MAG: hypothetical protein A3G88_06225 [Omnitrophica WOR_2 bacterium RIFCSPLOWO2_12_FULL_6